MSQLIRLYVLTFFVWAMTAGFPLGAAPTTPPEQKETQLKEQKAAEIFKQAISDYKNFRYDQAITEFTKAIEINPKYKAAYAGRAYAYFAKKDYDKTWEDVHKSDSIGKGPMWDPTFLNALIKASGRNK